jgi:hypothetical protein
MREVVSPHCPSVCLSSLRDLEMTKNQKTKHQEDEAAELLRLQDVNGLTADMAARLREAMHLSVSGEAGANLQALREIALVKVELRDHQRAALAESIRAGDLAVPADAHGAVQALGRDGLAALARPPRPTLTNTEVAAALAYRYLWEQAGKGAGLGSQLDDRPRAIRSSSHGAVAAGLLRAYVGVRLTAIETAVMQEDRSGRALSVLRAIAGEGSSLRSLGQGGNTKARNVEALRQALRVVHSQLHAQLHVKQGLRIRAH